MARILIIDDDSTVLDLEKKILIDAGYDIMVAQDALTALDLLELYKVDLIIVDIQMPRLNGFQFVTTVRSNPELNDISIAFLSASDESDTVKQAVKLGADFYLIKPIHQIVFLEKIKSFFEKKHPAKHAKIYFEDTSYAEVKVHYKVQLISASDFGVEVLVFRELNEGQIVELPTSVFNEIFNEPLLFKVLWVKPEKENKQRVFLVLVEHSSEIVRKIQRHVQKRQSI